MNGLQSTCAPPSEEGAQTTGIRPGSVAQSKFIGSHIDCLCDNARIAGQISTR
jgi:hypothetical protein